MAVTKLVVSREVTKEAYELGQGLLGMVEAVKTALADGWQTGTDLPAILTASFANLVPAIQGCDQLPAEAKEDLAPFIRGLTVSVEDIAFVFIKKSEAPVA